MSKMTLDTEKLMSALRNGLDPNDCQESEIDSLRIDIQDDANSFASKRAEEISKDIEESDAVYDLSALGGKRDICGVEFSMCLGNVVLLNTIKSPLINLELDMEVAYEDICEALYVIFKGKEAIKPIMAIAKRIQDLYSLKSLCKDNPIMCREVVHRVESISNARSEFTLMAIDFYEKNFLDQDLQVVFNGLIDMITDILKSVDEVSLPHGESKKKDLNAQTP